MNIDSGSNLAEVAATVADALQKSGIRAVLTGGGIATILTGGEYMSEDLDFILQSAPTRAELDRALGSIGFLRSGDHYVHTKTRFFIEFPRGPLSIGRDVRIEPAKVRIGDVDVLGLSATDSCRDRLAAFFFWNDSQSLDVAVRIALRHPVDLDQVARWAADEGMSARFDQFADELARRRSSGV